MKFVNENEKLAMTCSFYSVIANLALSLGKLVAGFLANSAAMVSDGVHSASDVLSTFVVVAGVKMSNKAEDSEHQYGHERMECVAAVILAGMLVSVAFGIGYSGYDKAFHSEPSELQVPGIMALVAAIISIVVKEGMFWYTKGVADKINSGALRADAWHHRSDAISSVGALIGIIGARMGYPILDPLASIVICLMILEAAYEVFKDAMDKMVDHSMEETDVEKILQVIESVKGVIHADEVHTRMFGSRAYVDVEISADDNLKLSEAHNIAEAVHEAIEINFPQVKHCMVHVNPVSELEHDHSKEIHRKC
ncbi:MAG: cation diffusion facilitator family transporter [Phascolarctobacterium sp.]|nr:cation diffusion facilitator family transporter [Phascolarctobacterium sp.]